jgi:hypothetical protein
MDYIQFYRKKIWQYAEIASRAQDVENEGQMAFYKMEMENYRERLTELEKAK